MRSTFLPYCKPFVGPEETAVIAELVTSGWLTTGPRVHEFEREFARRSGVPNALAVNSCTAALHLGMIALGVGPGDEVVMPSLTFVAGAQCARELGAKPVFADIDPETLSITPDTIRRVVTKRTKLIVPMHYGGRPAPIREIVEFARPRGIRVLEDAAHSVGMLSDGTWAGALSDAAAYSFYPTKNITTIEGGMLLSNDPAIVDRARVLSLHGMDRDAWKRYAQGGTWRYDVVEPGYKYNLPDIGAAMGLLQLRKLDVMQHMRNVLARHYIEGLAHFHGIRVVTKPLSAPNTHALCMFVIEVDPAQYGMGRDALIERLRQRNIGTSVHYVPTHLFSAYRDPQISLDVTERVWERILSLPLYPGMSTDDVDDVLDVLDLSAVAAAEVASG